MNNTSSSIHDRIIEILSTADTPVGNLSSVIADEFDISRQAAARHIRNLVDEGTVDAHGQTRGRTYTLSTQTFEKIHHLNAETISEDTVWKEFFKPKLADLPRNIMNICEYGVTEMVNNVLDHAEATTLLLKLKQAHNRTEINVIDNGIGIFEKIRQELKLDDPLHALFELTKGKLTTDPSNHTGEGIFFTSRMFDRFSIISNGIYHAYNADDKEWLMPEKAEDESKSRGTLVAMTISNDSTRNTKEVFDAYTGDGYGFNKTTVPVSLADYGEDSLISRSQAKRVLNRFEQFSEIVLDFKGVVSIGQGFADQVFRVFMNEHPNVTFRVINENDDVMSMILHVGFDPTTGRPRSNGGE